MHVRLSGNFTIYRVISIFEICLSTKMWKLLYKLLESIDERFDFINKYDMRKTILGMKPSNLKKKRFAERLKTNFYCQFKKYIK